MKKKYLFMETINDLKSYCLSLQLERKYKVKLSAQAANRSVL